MRIKGAVTRGVLRFNAWLGSTAGFVQSTIITLLWVPLVIFHVDPHGQLYLYVATALSLITQFSVAIYARHLEAGQKRFESYVSQMLQNEADLMKFIMGKLGEMNDDIEELLEEEHHEHRTGN